MRFKIYFSLACLLIITLPSITKASSLVDDFFTGYLGVYSEKISRNKANALGFENRYGSYVTKVVEDSPADKGGIQAFDYIYAIDGKEMTYNRDLNDFLRKYESGDKVTVSIIRKGQVKGLNIELGRRGYSSSFSNSSSERPFLGVSDACSCPEGKIGVKVNIINNSTAQEMGLRDGDIIESINGYSMYDWSDISTVLGSSGTEEVINISYVRVGKKNSAKGVLKSYDETKSFAATINREPAYLGIYSEGISRKKAEKLGINNNNGSYVKEVIKSSAAAEYGVQPFDYIYGVDEYRTGQRQSLTQILRKYRAGEEATVHLMRKGKEKAIKVKFGGKVNDVADFSTRCERPFLGVRSKYSNSGEEGASISVVDGSSADAMGMQDGDEVIYIENYKILDWQDLSIAISALEVGEVISVIVLRDGNEKTLSGKISSECDTPKNTFNETRFDSDSRNLNATLSEPNRFDIASFNDASRAKLPYNNNLTVERLKLEPADTRSYHKMTFNLPQKGDVVVKIFKENGREIYTYVIQDFSGDFTDETNLSINGEGTYYLQITQNDNSLVRKIQLRN